MIQSLDRGLRLLRLLREGSLSVSEAAASLGVSPSTASRLLATLEQNGLADQDAVTERFRLGREALYLGHAYTARFGWARELRPVLREIGQRCGETVSLSAYDGSRAVYLDRVEGVHPLRTIAQLGAAVPWHAGSTGKTILAHLPPAERATILAGMDWVRYTPTTITDRAGLEAELEAIAARGYGTSHQEIYEGVFGLAFPLAARDGQLLGAVGITAPLSRMDEAAQAAVADAIRAGLASWPDGAAQTGEGGSALGA